MLRSVGTRRGAACLMVLLLITLGLGRLGLAQGGDVPRILGFEAVQDWHLVAGSGTPTIAVALSEGASAIEISGNDWRRIRSIGFAPGIG